LDNKFRLNQAVKRQSLAPFFGGEAFDDIAGEDYMQNRDFEDANQI